MELKPGYKPSELGTIPDEWTEGTIGLLEPFITSGSRGWAQYYSDRGDIFVRITNMSRDSVYLDLSDSRFVRLPRSDREGERTQLQLGDLLISVTADIGIVSYVDSRVPTPAYINQHIALVRIDPDKVNRLFICYLLADERSQKRFRAITDQGAKAGINLTTVRNTPLVFPTRLEQDAIAEALRDADALIESLEKLIAKKRRLKQGAMQELLTGKKRLPGFELLSGYQMTELGLIPKDWRIEEVGRIAKVGRGRVISHKEIGAARSPTYPVFSSQTSNSGVMGYIDTYDFEGEYITWTTDGANAGTVFHRSGRFDCTNVCGTILPKTDNAMFIAKVLAGIAPRHVSRNLGNPKLMNDVMKRIQFPLPASRDEQAAIAGILSDLDAEISALEGRLEKYRQLKKGMMQELLTGRTRLV